MVAIETYDKFITRDWKKITPNDFKHTTAVTGTILIK